MKLDRHKFDRTHPVSSNVAIENPKHVWHIDDEFRGPSIFKIHAAVYRIKHLDILRRFDYGCSANILCNIKTFASQDYINLFPMTVFAFDKNSLRRRGHRRAVQSPVLPRLDFQLCSLLVEVEGDWNHQVVLVPPKVEL